MRKRIIQTIVLILIFATATVLGFYYLYLSKQNANLKIQSPFGNSFSIFSLFKHRTMPQKIIYGYLPYWQINNIEYLQLGRLTDIAYFGIHIKEDGNFLETLEDGTKEQGLSQWQNNKELTAFIKNTKDRNVRFALTIISHNDEVSNKFLDCQECWTTLYNNVTKELDKKNIKDVNLNFEYVEFTKPEYAQKYTQFVEYFNTQLDKKYGDSFVVVATFADSLVKPRVTDIPTLGKIADMLFIMAYDFHRPDSDNAGPVAPIDGKGVYAEYDLRTMLTDYLANVPPNKIILGVPYYGYNWVVKEGKPNSERIPGTDDLGYSQSQSYSAIMDLIVAVKPEVKWDDLGKVPFFVYVSPETGSTREVYFENEQSLSEKYKLVKDNDLAGVGIWALGYDGGYLDLWNLLYKEFDGD